MQDPPNQLAAYIVLEHRRYRLIEPLPSLGGGDFVLCSDENGAHFVCPEELWRRQAPQPAQSPGVSAASSAQEKIGLFLSLFRGREDVYAKRYYSLKTGESGYVPACKNEWEPGP